MFIIRLPTLLIIPLVFFSITACGNLNDNPDSESGKVQVSLVEIKKSLGYQSTRQDKKNQFYYPAKTDATDEIKSLIVGAMIVSSETPYSNKNPISVKTEDKFVEDLINSSNYFVIIPLPTDAETVSFNVPPPNAGSWQLIVGGLRTVPGTLSDLADKDKMSIAYYGFSDEIITAATVSDEPYNIKLERACLIISRPKGCASFNDRVDYDPIVTQSVEILGILINETEEYIPDAVAFPIFVYNDETETDAKHHLQYIKETIFMKYADNFSDLKTLTVRASHIRNPVENEDCKNLAIQNNVTAEEIENAGCSISEYLAVFNP